MILLSLGPPREPGGASSDLHRVELDPLVEDPGGPGVDLERPQGPDEASGLPEIRDLAVGLRIVRDLESLAVERTGHVGDEDHLPQVVGSDQELELDLDTPGLLRHRRTEAQRRRAAGHGQAIAETRAEELTEELVELLLEPAVAAVDRGRVDAIASEWNAALVAHPSILAGVLAPSPRAFRL